MACVSADLDCAHSYALQRLGTPNLILKPEQRSAAVIESICNGKDTFVWLPTGFGKSICYQTLPFVFDKMRMRKQWKPGPFLLPFSGLGTRLVLHVQRNSIPKCCSYEIITYFKSSNTS